MKQKLKNFFKNLDWNETFLITKLEGILMLATALLSGCIIGMICSPKHNKTIGCGNGCNNTVIPEEKKEDKKKQ